ncbi:MAG: hypothetical protein M1338_00280 [Patescibacteria group bacterium]|nr:hypothetical protein [Patescibacteria group bacterium]
MDSLFKKEGEIVVINWDFYDFIYSEFKDEILTKIVEARLLTTAEKGYMIYTNPGGEIINPILEEKILCFVQIEDAKNFALHYLSNTKYDWFIQEVNGKIVTTKKELIIKKPGQD